MSDNHTLNNLVSFNQIQTQLTEDFKNIIQDYKDSFCRRKAKFQFDYIEYLAIIKNDVIIFNNENIILFNFLELKLIYDDEKNPSFFINFLHAANKQYMELINIINLYWNDILRLLIKWNHNYKIFGEPINNFLDKKYLNSIIKILKEKSKFELLIPIKDLIYKNYSEIFDELNINDKFELILSLNIDKNNNQLFNYEILLLETTNIDVTKATPYLLSDAPQRLILEGQKTILELSHFLETLYLYGRI